MNEKIKQIKRQSVLDKIEFDIQESMNQTIKKSIIDIDEIIRNPKQKINSLPEKRSSINSFAKSFYEEDIINEVGDTREDYMKSKYNSGKSFTTPLIPKNDPKIFSFVNFRQLLPKTTVSVDSMSQKSIDLKFKPTASKNEDMYDLSFDFDPASYVSQQFIKGYFI